MSTTTTLAAPARLSASMRTLLALIARDGAAYVPAQGHASTLAALDRRGLITRRTTGAGPWASLTDAGRAALGLPAEPPAPEPEPLAAEIARRRLAGRLGCAYDGCNVAARYVGAVWADARGTHVTHGVPLCGAHASHLGDFYRPTGPA